MSAIIFKKKRGEVIDVFNVLCMYSHSPSLYAIFRGYNVKPDPALCDSYARLCKFIDDNVKTLRPFFVKRENSVYDGSIFHKMTQMILAQDDLFMSDVLNFFRRMGSDLFLAEIFRLTDGKPESFRQEYLEIAKDPKRTDRFLSEQNYTVREYRAIKAFQREKEFEFDCFIQFLEKLHKRVVREHRINSEMIFRYTDWLQYRLFPEKAGFIFDDPYFTFKDMDNFESIIVTVSLFPPYSCNRLVKENIVVLSFGVGALVQDAYKYYRNQVGMRKSSCGMRENILRALTESDMRLLDLAEFLNTSSADVSYHLGYLEQNGFIKRVRVREKELFTLCDSGMDFLQSVDSEQEDLPLLTL